MPTPRPISETARTVEDQFLDLVYGDTDLLAAELDAIIAAEWPEPPGLVAAPLAGILTVVQPAAQPTPSGARSPGPDTPASADGPGSVHPRSDTRRTTGRKAGDRHT